MNKTGAILLTLLVGTAQAAYDVKPSAIVPEWSGAEPGVWTMDYAAATNNAATAGNWTVMQFTGMWWCPHCQALEEGVLTTSAWSNYVDRVGLYLVAMDYPYRDGYSNFCWLWDENYRLTKCGGMSAAEGTNTIYRRYGVQDAWSVPDAARQVVKLYDDEGFVTNTIEYGRIGYPTLLVVRPGGGVAGRFTVSKNYANIDYVTNRIEQLRQTDAWDEPDNFWQTATELELPACEEEPIAQGSHTLSLADTVDWYRIAITNAAGALWNFSCSESAQFPAAALKVELYDDPTDDPIVSEELLPGVNETLSRIIATKGEYWLKVMPAKSLQNAVGYDFSYSYSVSPATVAFVKDSASVRSTVAAVTLSVTIADADRDAEVTIDWKTLDVTATNGVDYSSAGGTLIWPAGTIKRAKTIEIPLIGTSSWKGNRTFEVKLYPRRHCVIPEAVDSCRVTIVEARQRKPGTLSFDKAAVKTQQVVREGEPIELEISRTGGTDGAVTGIVTIVEGRLSQVVTNLVWAHGSDDVRIVRYAPAKTPDQIREDTAATLKLAATGGARLGISSAKLLLRDELVEQPFKEYSKAEWNGALSTSGVEWFYGRIAASAQANVLRSCPLEGDDTEIAYKLKGPAIVTVSAVGHGESELSLRLDRLVLTNGFPARVAIPSGSHTVALSARGEGSAFVQVDFSTVALTDYRLQAETPRDGRRLAVSEQLALTAGFVQPIGTVAPGVSVITRIGSSNRLTELPAAEADVLTDEGYAYPQNGEQRTALQDYAEDHFTETLQWRMDVRFEDDFGNVAEQAGVAARFVPLDAAAPCIDLSKSLPTGWTADAGCAELDAPDLTVGVEVASDRIALGNLSGGVVSVTVKSGKLPPGVKLSVEEGALCLRGVPTSAGSFVAEIVVNEKVTSGRRTTTVAGCSYQLRAAVRALDEVASTYNGYSTENMPDGSVGSGSETATLTVAKTGKISGKLVYQGKTLSFAESAWDARTNDTFYLEASVRWGVEYLPVRVRLELSDELRENGDVQIELSDRTYWLYANRWKTVEGAVMIAPLVGTYAGALVRKDTSGAAPQGTGYVSLSVKQDGTVIYSGVNSLGKTFSGRTTLFRAYDCCSASGSYFGFHLSVSPSGTKVVGSGLYGLVEIAESDSANILSGRGSALVRDVNLDGNSIYEGVAWTNVLEVVGGSVDVQGLIAGDEWTQSGLLEGFADYDGRDGVSGYQLESAPSNLVLSAVAPGKAAVAANDWNATISSFAKATGIASLRFVLNYEGATGVKKRTLTGKGIYVPHSTYGKPFWAGYYTVPEVQLRETGSRTSKVTLQTPFPWLFE